MSGTETRIARLRIAKDIALSKVVMPDPCVPQVRHYFSYIPVIGVRVPKKVGRVTNSL